MQLHPKIHEEHEEKSDLVTRPNDPVRVHEGWD